MKTIKETLEDPFADLALEKLAYYCQLAKLDLKKCAASIAVHRAWLEVKGDKKFVYVLFNLPEIKSGNEYATPIAWLVSVAAGLDTEVAREALKLVTPTEMRNKISQQFFPEQN